MDELSQLSVAHSSGHVRGRNTQGNTVLLHTAVKRGDLNTLKSTLFSLHTSDLSTQPGSESPGTPNQVEKHRDAAGNTVLHTACTRGKIDIVRFLTDEVECDQTSTNSEGQDCLHLATQHGHLPVVKHLVAPNSAYSNSLSYIAAREGHLDVLKYLVEDRGADPHFVVNQTQSHAGFASIAGQSLLHAASLAGKLDVLKYLMAAILLTMTPKESPRSTLLVKGDTWK